MYLVNSYRHKSAGKEEETEAQYKEKQAKEGRPVRYFDNIVYCNNLSNVAIRYLLLAIAITATEIIIR